VRVTRYAMNVLDSESSKRDPKDNIKDKVCILIHSCIADALNYNF
jgi:hypothetical protein